MGDAISRSGLLKIFHKDMKNPLWHFTGIRAAIENAQDLDVVPADRFKWRRGSCLPRERGEVLVIARGKPKENIQLLDAYELAEYVPGEGWIFEAYPEWEGGEVRWWMPLPEEPKEGAHV